MASPAEERVPVIALVGQPNCGKSTLFNSLAGFKANTGNFPGTSVSYTTSEVALEGRLAQVIDLPGTYSISPNDPAEKVTRDYLLSGQADVILTVMDASVLSRCVELTLQLLEMGLPLVVALNMLDDAERKGIRIDVAALSERLGVPVIPTIATRGTGVMQVALAALAVADAHRRGRPPTYDRDVEHAVSEVVGLLPAGLAEGLCAPPRFVALRLLEGDEVIEEAAGQASPAFLEMARAQRRRLAELHDWPEEGVLGSHRHAVAMDLFEAVAHVRTRQRRPLADRVDDWVMHPVAGPLLALVAFGALFGMSFVVGGTLAKWVGLPFDALLRLLAPRAAHSLPWALLKGLVDGVAGGVGIVLPYLVPLLVVMALFEDLGYLPRVAFLADGLLHRIGLHGKSIIPLILGYGCNVPALMGTRILESPRDRVLTAMLVPLVPCSARTVVILALVAGFLGPLWALAIFLLNLVVAGGVGRLLSARVKGRHLGLLMDVPPYRLPPAKNVAKKVWFRAYEFLVQAWPVLIVASIVMGVLEYVGINRQVNHVLRPLTVGLLGLPEVVGVTLFFGVLRKELSLVLLFEALGTRNVASAMTPAQILGFTLFVTFYVPCVATITTLVKEVGWRWAVVSIGINTSLALLIAGLARLVL